MTETAIQRIIVRENKSLGVRAEGKYEYHRWLDAKPERGGYWQLTHWRVRYKPDAEFGKWYKVHGNQKRKCAGFALTLDQMPDTSEPA